MRLRILALTGLALLVGTVFPTSAGAGGYCVSDPVTDRRGHDVDVKGDCFFPNVIRVEAGESVTWTNYDSHPHTVTGVGLWGSGHAELATGDEVTYSFDEEGVYLYSCLLHPGMVGAVIVGDGTGKTTGASVKEAAGAPPPASGSDSGDGGSSSPLPVIAFAVGAAGLLAAGAWTAAYRLRARRSSTAPTTAP